MGKLTGGGAKRAFFAAIAFSKIDGESARRCKIVRKRLSLERKRRCTFREDLETDGGALDEEGPSSS